MYPPPRKLAWDVIHRVDREKAYADLLLDQVLRKPSLKEEDRAFITELVYGTLRWRGRLDHVISLFSSKPLNRLDPEILNILRMGAYQLLYLRTPSSAAVDESVKLSKNFTSGKASGFVNAVLRAVDRDRDNIKFPSRDEDEAVYLSVKHSHPKWLVSMYAKTLAVDELEEMLAANNQLPPLTLRVNKIRATREELIKALLVEDGIEAEPTKYSPDGIAIKDAPPVRSISAFNQGLCVVQDEAAQLVALIMDPKPGFNVLDTCAAPGGKTTHIAALMENKGEVNALDANQSRISMIEDNARRLGITIIKARRGDASAPLKYDRNSFNAILVDPPCSDLGVIRRHPDVKWIKTSDQINELAELQLKIISTAAKYVKPEGVIVYAVCTVSDRENEQVIEKFMETNPLFQIEPVSKIIESAKDFETPEGFARLMPHKTHTDGFFIARLKRNSK